MNFQLIVKILSAILGLSGAICLFIIMGSGDEEIKMNASQGDFSACLLYTSPSPRDPKTPRMPSSA